MAADYVRALDDAIYRNQVELVKVLWWNKDRRKQLTENIEALQELRRAAIFEEAERDTTE